jgi:hypothetical protein
MDRRFGRLLCLLFAGWICLVPGCGDDSTSPQTEPVRPLVQGTVDESGGELEHDEVILTVPDGALAEMTDLAVYSDLGDHPFDEDYIPTYRITGLPSDLGVPVTLRFRHGLTLAGEDSLTLLLGEMREAYSGGSGFNWQAIAGRDSSGWYIAELPRGALDLGEKADDAEVKITVSRNVKWLASDRNHFEICYDPANVARAEAIAALDGFDTVYDVFYDWGFRFGGDESIWPLDVYIRDPEISIACYVPAPQGAGFFVIEPDLLQPGIQSLPVIAHEMFHCVQMFYDPRGPEEWGKLNRERLWLDEATAAYFEVVSNESDEVHPLGVTDDNYAAPLAGIAGHASLEAADYGYGMSSFIRYLVDHGNPTQGEARILELYQHFITGGDVTDAIDAVIEPAVSSWCVGMHRQWAEKKIFPAFADLWFWSAWPIDAQFESEVGSNETVTLTVPDLGADIAKFHLEGFEPLPMTSLMVKAGQDDATQSREQLPLTVYGRASNSSLALIATGVDSLNISNWPALHGAYDDILVMVSRPFSTAAGHTGSREIAVEAKVTYDVAAIDITRFTNVSITVKAHSELSSSGLYPNYQINTAQSVTWNGSGFTAVTYDDTFHVQIDPETLALGDWYGYEQYETSGGSYIRKRLGGYGVPLYEVEPGVLNYHIRGLETCERLTHFFQSTAWDALTDPHQTLLSYYCVETGELSEESYIFVKLFYME